MEPAAIKSSVQPDLPMGFYFRGKIRGVTHKNRSYDGKDWIEHYLVAEGADFQNTEFRLGEEQEKAGFVTSLDAPNFVEKLVEFPILRSVRRGKNDKEYSTWYMVGTVLPKVLK